MVERDVPFDEPLANLDQPIRDQTRRKTKKTS